MYPWIILMLTLGFALDHSVGNHGRVLDSWRGQAAQQLVVRWGEPDSTGKTEDGKEVYTYTRVDFVPTFRRRTPVVGNFVPRTRNGAPAVRKFVPTARNFASTAVMRRCISRFVIDDNRIIVESSYEGEYCMDLYGKQYSYNR